VRQEFKKHAPFPTEEVGEALSKLGEILRPALNRTVFLNTGSEAVELGLKIARAATWAPAQQALLANNVPAEQLGEAMGQLSAFWGPIGFPAPYLGGLLYDRFGFQAPILANLVGVVVALVMILLAVKEPSLTERDR